MSERLHSRLVEDKRLQFIIGKPSCVYWQGERIATKAIADILIYLILHEGQHVRPEFFARNVGLTEGTIKVLLARLRLRLHQRKVAFNISHNNDRQGWRLMRFD